MIINTSWLQEYLSRTMSTRQMADALELAGIEVEQISSPAVLDKKIIVATVKNIVQHPNADKLQLVELDSGKSIVRVVCGAPNIRVGQKVALAQVGAGLPDGTTIEEVKIRGELSCGMICSERELGLGQNHDGIMILEAGAKPGTALCDLAINSDIMNITTAANRFDLLSYLGLAREIAARHNIDIKMPVLGQEWAVASDVLGNIDVENNDIVRRLSFTKLTVSGNSKTPDLLKRHIADSGLRPIMPAVDITNYIMLETGQPMHAFDSSKVKGRLVARMAKEGEKLETLDGVTRTLSSKDLIIADDLGALSLAGVMGGSRTQVAESTTEIILEVASFHPGVVRKMAKRHGLRTEASSRFERNLPVELVEFGVRRALEEANKTFGWQQIGQAADLWPTRRGGFGEASVGEVRQINIEPAVLSKKIGLAVSMDEIKFELARLGIDCSKENDGQLMAQVPWWRPDIINYDDILEEIVKMIGYDAIPATLPAWRPAIVQFDRRSKNIWDLKKALKALGLFEVLTYSFVGADQLKSVDQKTDKHLALANPLSSEQAYLRSDLLASLLTVTARNKHYAKEFGIFEISRVFIAGSIGSLPAEPLKLAVLMRTQEDGYIAIKEVLDTICYEFNVALIVKPGSNNSYEPQNFAGLYYGDNLVGSIGQISKACLDNNKIVGAVGYLEIALSGFWDGVIPKVYQELSKYPAITRDLTVLIPQDLTWAEIAGDLLAISEAKVSFVGDYFGSDIPKGQKSLTLRLIIQSMESTLMDKQADIVLGKIKSLLQAKFGAKERL